MSLKKCRLNLDPIGLSRVQAASYIGVSATKFDELVKDGRMPPPKAVDGRRIWCRDEVEEAFHALPHVSDDEQQPGDPWVTGLAA